MHDGTGPGAHAVVEAYWAAAEARDWSTFTALLAEGVVYVAAASRERVRGRDAYVRFNAEGFRGAWHVVVRRIVGEGRHAASWIEFAAGAVTETGLCFFDFDEDGRIASITDFWPAPYEPPADRAHLVERF